MVKKDVKVKGLHMHDFGLFVSRRRGEMGMTQEELGRKIGKVQALVVRIESGRCTVNSIPFALLASALRVEVEHLHWALIGVDFLSASRDTNLIGLLRSIVLSDTKTLNPKDLLRLLRIESGLATQKLTMTADMVPSLLKQIRT
jgi:transcriptional regulator with XRE-family HTH domain